MNKHIRNIKLDWLFQKENPIETYVMDLINDSNMKYSFPTTIYTYNNQIILRECKNTYYVGYELFYGIHFKFNIEEADIFDVLQLILSKHFEVEHIVKYIREITVYPGDRFDSTFERAKEKATDWKETVYFEFNGMTIFVNSNTDIEKTYTDYINRNNSLVQP